MTETTLNPKDRNIPALPAWKVVRELIRFRPWLWFVDLTAVGLVRFCWQVGPALIMKAFFDFLTGGAQLTFGIWTIIVCFIALFFGRLLATYGFYYADVPIFADLGTLLRKNLLAHILKRPGASQLPDSAGEAVCRFKNDVQELPLFVILINDVMAARVAARHGRTGPRDHRDARALGRGRSRRDRLGRGAHAEGRARGRHGRLAHGPPGAAHDQALRKLTGITHRTGTTLFFINQLRQKIGVTFGSPETTTGGNALKFYASMRMDVRRIGQVKVGDELVGGRTRVKICKNKCAPPFTEAEFEIRFGEGVDSAAELIDLGLTRGLLDKSGKHLSFAGTTLGNGRERSREAVLGNAKLTNSHG